MKHNVLYAAIAAAFSGLGLGHQRQYPRGGMSGPPTTGGNPHSGPSEVAHLSKRERLKRRRIHRLSTRKRK